MRKKDIIYLREYFALGMFSYTAYDEQMEPISKVHSSVSGDVSLVTVDGRTDSYRSEFDREMTLVPGFTARKIFAEKDTSIAEILWKGSSQYLLRQGEFEIDVLYGEDRYDGFAEREQIFSAIRTKRPEFISDLIEDRNSEKVYEIHIYEPLPESVIAMITALLAFRFAM